MTESDLQLLDAYLDDELSTSERRVLEDRLASEPALGDELARLREGRDLRVQLFRSMEPAAASVDRLMDKFESGINRRERFLKLGQVVRVASAAAACILLGFVVGWMGRAQPSAGVAGADSTAISSPNMHVVGTAPGATRGQPAYEVALKDESGKTIAVQRFDTLEKARAFAEDVNRWQEKQMQAQQGNVVITGDRF